VIRLRFEFIKKEVVTPSNAKCDGHGWIANPDDHMRNMRCDGCTACRPSLQPSYPVYQLIDYRPFPADVLPAMLLFICQEIEKLPLPNENPYRQVARSVLDTLMKKPESEKTHGKILQE
jgi:hypothetical protein